MVNGYENGFGAWSLCFGSCSVGELGGVGRIVNLVLVFLPSSGLCVEVENGE
jgi:hypothetical protein